MNGLALLSGLTLHAVMSAGVAGEPALRLDTRPVPLSEDADAGFGALRPLGMIEILSRRFSEGSLSQLSGLAWDDDDGFLYAVTDKGRLFHLRPEFKDGRLVGLEGLKTFPLLDLNTGKRFRGPRADSEGLDILNGRNGIPGDAELVISFERQPRLVHYRPDGTPLGEIPLPEILKQTNLYASGNRMLEAVCHDPALGYLTAPESPRRDEPEGFTRLYSHNGKAWLYPVQDGSYLSALECLGNKQVLVLERDFGRRLGRTVATLRLADLSSPPRGKPVPVRTLTTLSVADGHLIDNFEGLARHREQRFFTVSDDNDLFFQRTLLLYFELDLGPASGRQNR